MRPVSRKLLSCLLVAAMLPASVGVVAGRRARATVQPAAGAPMDLGPADGAHCCGCCTGECGGHCCLAEVAPAAPVTGPEPDEGRIESEEERASTELRPSACSGLEPWLAFQAVEWQGHVEPCIAARLPLIWVQCPGDSTLPDPFSLCVDPPPPRGSAPIA